jgi:4-hydroxy-4-methyl-2-oxoglutarate aldolase
VKPELNALIEAGTAAVSDVFDILGLMPPVVDNNGSFMGEGNCRFAGPAYTIQGGSHRWAGGGDRAKLEAIDLMPEGVVAVWAGGDIRGVCCFGDLLATAMKARGITGAVVDGGVRDSVFIRSLGLPLMARYRTPAQAIGRWHVTARQVAVQVRGALEDWITVRPGDIVVADEDGVVVVPRNHLDQVLERVLAMSVQESRARREIAAGLPLLEALDKYGHL